MVSQTQDGTFAILPRLTSRAVGHCTRGEEPHTRDTPNPIIVDPFTNRLLHCSPIMLPGQSS
jgi:hypothetical protein